MPNNVFIGSNSVVALQDATMLDIGFNINNLQTIYLVQGAIFKSFAPGRQINGITGVVKDAGYFLVSKVDTDLTTYFYPDFISSSGVFESSEGDFVGNID